MAVQCSGVQVMEIRQTAPLPEVEQPPNGHRLVYYMLGGEHIAPAMLLMRRDSFKDGAASW